MPYVQKIRMRAVIMSCEEQMCFLVRCYSPVGHLEEDRKQEPSQALHATLIHQVT